MIPKSQTQKDFENWCHFASETLRQYNQLLFEWKFLAPNELGADFHFLFVEALQNSARVKHLLCTLAFGTEEEKRDLYLTCREEVKKIHERIQAYEHSGSEEASEAE